MRFRQPIVLALVVGLALALPAFAGKPNAPDPAVTELGMSSSLGNTARNFGEAFGDNLFTIDATVATGHVLLLGVEYANGSYWVSSGGAASTLDANFLFQLDGSGTVVNSWNQGTTSDWGWRDFAFDGTYLYASDSNVLDQIDPATGTATGVTIPCPENPCRALAYDPATDHFWTANFSSNIYEFDRTGAVINSYANTLSMYGFAFDGTYLWGCSQDGPGVQVTQFDPATGAATGVTFNGDGSGGGTPIAGGCTWSNTVSPGNEVLVVMHQADSDTIVGYDAAGGEPPPSCDDPEYTIVFDEAFDSGFPGVMGVVNNGGDCVWADDLNGTGNLTGGSGSLGDADSDGCGSGTTMDTTMTTPAIPLGGATEVYVEFAQDYNNLSSTEIAEVEVSSDGSSWTQVWFRNADDRGPITYNIDVSSELGGATEGYVRFHYVAPGWDWWWQVDDIQVCTAAQLGEADLDIMKTSATTSPTTARYTITVQNLGPDDASGVVVTDDLPAGVAYVSDDCGGVSGTPWTWTIGTLTNGDSVTCNIDVDVLDFGDTTNVATVSGATTDPNGSNDSSTAVLQPFGGPIPTLGGTGILLLVILIAGVGLFLVRRAL
jgi:uncharacterized repeat protein (TIGR01451 family)